MTGVGDHWREFALAAARMARRKIPPDYAALAHQLNDLAAAERDIYRDISLAVPR